MRLKTFLFTVLFVVTTTIFGQIKKQIQFVGYNMMQYQQPVQVSGNKYKAYFKNMGESREQGRIVVDETAKTFTIKWLNGDDWECNFTKKDIKKEHDDWFGDVENTTYTGKWSDDNIDCILLLTKTKSAGCITTLKSKKVVDTDYDIDSWKKIFTFGTSGKCFD